MKLEGVFVALVTPFENGRINEEKIRELVRLQLENGTDGIVPCGTTGESPALSEAERNRVIEIVIEEVDGKATVIAGTGTNNTDSTMQATQRAKEMGADAALVITPYYNKPTQEGLFRHFEAVARSVDLPVVIYNVPARTSVNMLPETVARLMQFDNIVAIKEASGDLVQISEVIQRCGDRLSVLSGDDLLFAPILIVGGCGIISVTSNVAPREVKALYEAFRASDPVSMSQWHQKLFPLSRALFLETNPIPVKTALNLIGKEVGEVRLPLAPMSEANRNKLAHVLQEYGLV
ncbi:MAG: 4-hydroxy-tetrahydrodipicolinate synthase [bacterium]